MNRFKEVRQWVEDYLRKNNQLPDGPDGIDCLGNHNLKRRIIQATCWRDITEAIDIYWGWQDESTVFMLEDLLIKFVPGLEDK